MAKESFLVRAITAEGSTSSRLVVCQESRTDAPREQDFRYRTSESASFARMCHQWTGRTNGKRMSPNATDGALDKLLLTHTPTDKLLGLRGYITEVMDVLKCHQDVQVARGGGLLLKYARTHGPLREQLLEKGYVPAGVSSEVEQQRRDSAPHQEGIRSLELKDVAGRLRRLFRNVWRKDRRV
eukprot:2712311-Amphidinium_carterae.2